MKDHALCEDARIPHFIPLFIPHVFKIRKYNFYLNFGKVSSEIICDGETDFVPPESPEKTVHHIGKIFSIFPFQSAKIVQTHS